MEKFFVLKDLIVCLDKENKIKLEIGENPIASSSMVSFGSFDLIPISGKKQTFFDVHDACKSLVKEFGPHLLEGAIPVKFEVDGEITINYVYLGMDRPNAPNRPTFYEIMTGDLDV